MTVLGLDLGGTSTRAVLATLDGDIVGRGRAGGGNPVSHGASSAAAQLALALAAALDGADPAAVRGATIGLAGVGALTDESRAAFADAWQSVGLTCDYELIRDAEVAFAAGTAGPDGHVLIAGTGAIACSIVDRGVDRLADGHGWLLGDTGSGFWLGREAVRVTLAEIDRGGPPTALATAVVGALLGDQLPPGRAGISEIVRAVHARPPIALAELAPVALAAGPSLVDAAASALLSSLSVVRGAGDHTPVVLAGGLLTAATPLAEVVDAGVRKTWPGAPVAVAGDGAAAAAWMAAKGMSTVDPAVLHGRLVGTGGR